MPTIIKHGDFTFDDEKIEEIAKNLEVYNKKKAILGQFFSPNAAINGDRLTKRRQILLDPVAVANLNEGQTPRKDSIKLVTFSQALRAYGSYIEYTRQAFKKNRDSITEMARRQLVHNRIYDIEATRFGAMNSTTYTIDAVYGGSPAAFNWWKTFANAKIKALKNKGKGRLIFFCTPEIAESIAEEAKAANSLLQGTAEGASLILNGYLGDYNGVHIVECAEDYMYPSYEAYTAASYPGSGTSDQKAAHAAAVAAYNAAYGTHYAATDDLPAVTAGTKNLAFFIVKTEDGQWPLVENRLGEGNIEVISKEIGSAGTADPTNEKGTIAARIDDVGAFLEHPECVYAVRNILGTMLSKVSSDLPAAYKIVSAFETVSGGAGGDPTHVYGQGGGLHSVIVDDGVETSASRQVVSPVSE